MRSALRGSTSDLEVSTMRFSKTLLLSIPVLALSALHAGDASACGGCFHEDPNITQTESTQVTGHKMILSVSNTQTTLWDQISYMGNPSSFAWVLPIKGTVEVGLSSDALFQNLEVATQVNVSSPVIACDPAPVCGQSANSSGTGDFGGGSGGGSGGPAVVVTSQSVVGPYEQVQLHSTDPAALTTWLKDHNFVVPPEVLPIINDYVGEGFDFLALKLVPGKDVSAMRPVRITMPGASPVLPLRMVAAGTGVKTPISLWILGEGRYEATNMPDFTIDSPQLTWDWDTMSSNYAVLKSTTFAASQGKAWLVEAGEPFSPYFLQDTLGSLAQYDPVGSGYADDMGNGAPMAAQADLDTLFGTLDPSSVWVTRLYGELSREALVKDLTIGASSDQTPVNRFLQATKTKGTAPTCPTYPPCPDDTTSGGNSTGDWDFWNNGTSGKRVSSGCAMTQDGGFSSTLAAFGVLAALAMVRRRRSR
jgi:MYXO-CTERM domain-containing protein